MQKIDLVRQRGPLWKTAYTRLNSYSVSSDPLELEPELIGYSGLPFGQPLYLVGALVNKRMPCAWLLSWLLKLYKFRHYEYDYGGMRTKVEMTVGSGNYFVLLDGSCL